jgi:adenylosuccinate synthase
MQNFVGVPVVLVGVGPGRDDVIWTGAGASTTPGRAAEPAGAR